MLVHVFQNVEGVTYGYSGFNQHVVVKDPFVFSEIRIVIYVTIALGLITSWIYALNLWKKLQTRKLLLGSEELKWLIFLGIASITASGLHHFDNFFRVDKYFLVSWIYNGFFCILDVGIANWVIASCLALFGMNELVKQECSNSNRVFALRCLYVHCIMIWSGQLHYSVEPIYNFDFDANVSILAEGFFAALFHVFLLRNRLALEAGGNPRGGSIEYEMVPQSLSGENPEPSSGTVRRRSRENIS